MSIFSDAFEEEQKQNRLEQARQDAYYGKPPQSNDSEYLKEYNEVKDGDNWRYKPRWE